MRRAESVSRRYGVGQHACSEAERQPVWNITRGLSVAELVIEHVSDSVARESWGHIVCAKAPPPHSHRLVGYLGEIKTGAMDGPK